jgi:hypothetical protein
MTRYTTAAKLITRDGREITRLGTSGFIVTAVRTGGDAKVLMDFDVASKEEAKAMVGMLLAQLEELHGERFVANCVEHYAEATGKQFLEEGGRRMFMIRGHRRDGHP